MSSGPKPHPSRAMSKMTLSCHIGTCLCNIVYQYDPCATRHNWFWSEDFLGMLFITFNISSTLTCLHTHYVKLTTLIFIFCSDKTILGHRHFNCQAGIYFIAIVKTLVFQGSLINAAYGLHLLTPGIVAVTY